MPKSVDRYFVKVFNWSEFHLSEMTCYKIRTLNLLTVEIGPFEKREKEPAICESDLCDLYSISELFLVIRNKVI